MSGTGKTGEGVNRGAGALFVVDAAAFLADDTLSHEVFGATSLVVRCRDEDELVVVSRHLEGQLTATLQIEPDDYARARRLLPVLEAKVGRILVNGWPDGRRSQPRHGARRPLPGDLGQPHDLGRLAGDPPLPPAGLLSGPAGRTPCPRPWAMPPWPTCPTCSTGAWSCPAETRPGPCWARSGS